MLSRRSVLIPLCAAFLLVLGTTARATDATGTWKWSTPGRNGGEPRETTLKLKQDGEKLTGTISMGGGANARETEIRDGKIKDGELSFKVTRKGRNDNEITSNYSGKLDGDVIKGKVEMNFNGTPRSREFEAKRAKE